MTIKQIAEKCGVKLKTRKWAIDGNGKPYVQDAKYSESDISKMLRYVAMEVAYETIKVHNSPISIEGIVNQVLGEE